MEIKLPARSHYLSPLTKFWSLNLVEELNYLLGVRFGFDLFIDFYNLAFLIDHESSSDNSKIFFFPSISLAAKPHRFQLTAVCLPVE